MSRHSAASSPFLVCSRSCSISHLLLCLFSVNSQTARAALSLLPRHHGCPAGRGKRGYAVSTRINPGLSPTDRIHPRFGDVHYFYGPPTASPPHHRFDKGSYVYLFENAHERRARLEVANQPGTEEQDAFDGCENTPPGHALVAVWLTYTDPRRISPGQGPCNIFVQTAVCGEPGGRPRRRP